MPNKVASLWERKKIVLHPLHPSIDQFSYWPYTPQETSCIHPTLGDTRGAWRLGLSAEGSLVLWPARESFPEQLGLLPVYFHNDREVLEDVFVMFSLGVKKI